MPILKRRVALLVVLLLLASNVPVPAQSPRAPDPELAAGIALVREGDFEAAVLKLDTVVRRLLADAARHKEAAQAYLYLGVAFLELNTEPVARSKFQQALALDPRLRMDAREFSPEQIRMFESARVEPRTPPAVAASPSPGPRSSPPAAGTAVAANEEKKKKKRSPLLWILGGAAVVGAGAAAAAGGGGGGAQPTTTSQPIGNTSSTAPSTTPPDTTPTTTQPGEPPPPTTTTVPTTTLPGAPTTTVPPTTTPPTSSTTTTSTTTTTMPACTYSVTGPTPPTFGVSGGPGTCDVTTQAGCSWTATTSAPWINFQTSTGTGSGQIRFNIELNGTLQPRQANIVLLQGSQPTCNITQAALLTEPSGAVGSLTWTSELDLDGAQGQVVVDGSSATFQARGAHQGWVEATAGVHRIEATVVDCDGKPGTWRFRLAGPVLPGSLRVIAGPVASAGGEEVVFRLSGKPGERVLFSFRLR